MLPEPPVALSAARSPGFRGCSLPPHKRRGPGAGSGPLLRVRNHQARCRAYGTAVGVPQPVSDSKAVTTSPASKASHITRIPALSFRRARAYIGGHMVAAGPLAVKRAGRAKGNGAPTRIGTPFRIQFPAATYSPAPSPGKYHRRWRA